MNQNPLGRSWKVLAMRGVSSKEAARAMQCSVGTAKQRLREAFQNIDTIIKSNEQRVYSTKRRSDVRSLALEASRVRRSLDPDAINDPAGLSTDWPREWDAIAFCIEHETERIDDKALNRVRRSIPGGSWDYESLRTAA